MSVRQLEVSLPDLAARLLEADRLVLCGHVSPDGDCIGSQLALSHALQACGKEVTCVLAGTGVPDEGLMFLPGVKDMIPASDFTGEADAFVACDVPTRERLGDAAALQERCSVTFTIDHHKTEKAMSHYAYIDPESASTTMIIWDLIKALHVTPSKEMAVSAYTGLVTDTGCFQFQNTTATVFHKASEMIAVGVDPSLVACKVFQSRRLASLRLESILLDKMVCNEDKAYVLSFLTRADFENAGAKKVDAEPLINVIRSLAGIRVACVLREEEHSIRGSLRAKDATDVSSVARRFGGGGHKAAAGFTLYTSLEEAIRQVSDALDEILSEEQL